MLNKISKLITRVFTCKLGKLKATEGVGAELLTD